MMDDIDDLRRRGFKICDDEHPGDGSDEGTLTLKDITSVPHLPLIRSLLSTPVSDMGMHIERGEVFVLLGRTIGMPGHVTVARFKDGQVFVNLHEDNFELVPEGEV